jgi:putative Mn2+ efflux pump MntP
MCVGIMAVCVFVNAFSTGMNMHFKQYKMAIATSWIGGFCVAGLLYHISKLTP